jgi:hypothetical protein
VDELLILRPLELFAVLGLSVVFREAYNAFMLYGWYLSIDMHSILFHVEFKDGLSISVFKTRATHYQNLHLEIVIF